MTNNYENENNEQPEIGEDFIDGADENLEGAEGVVEEKSLSDKISGAWHTQPLFKFLALLVGVFAVGVAAFSFMGGDDAAQQVSHLARPPNVKEIGGGKVSPYMREQTELANKERSDAAIASGGSAMPTPIGQTTDMNGFGAAEKKDEALNEMRAEVERLKAQQQQQQVMLQQSGRQPERFDNSLAEAMQRQMQQLLESWSPRGIKQVTVVNPSDLNRQGSGATSATNVTPASATSSVQTKAKALVPAGTVSYAQLLTEANSDVPGPILAQIVSGPLSGARAIGSFEVADGYEKYLVLKFTLADKKGKDYSISAIALDPGTTLGGMATEVDERYFSRVVLPAAAGFLQGMGQAIGQGDSTITTSGDTTIVTNAGNGVKKGIYTGLGQAASTMGQFFQNQANVTKPLVRVAAGTPMGLFFVSPVFDPDAAAAMELQNRQTQSQQQGYGNYGYGSNVPANGNSATVTSFGQTTANGSSSNVPYPNYAKPYSVFQSTRSYSRYGQE